MLTTTPIEARLERREPAGPYPSERPGPNHLRWLPDPSKVLDLITFTGEHGR
jgi:hypothetical protein